MGAEAALAFQGINGVLNGIGSAATAGQIKSTYPTTNPAAGAMALQQAATGQQVAAYDQQADEALKEYGLQAVQKAQEVALFRDQQANAYDASGVMLEGSPMLELNRTVQLGQQEINAITSRGEALADLFRRNALVVADTGRAQLVGDQANFITQSAASRMQALQTKSGLLATGANDIMSAIGKTLPLFGGGSPTSAGPVAVPDPFGGDPLDPMAGF